MLTRAQRSQSQESQGSQENQSAKDGEEVEMSRALPNFGEFNASVEDVESYVERLESYFVVNKVVDDKEKVNIFITLVGPETYGLIKRLVVPLSHRR